MSNSRTSGRAVNTTALPCITVQWQCVCHADGYFARQFAIDEMERARRLQRELKRNEHVQPLTVHVNDHPRETPP